MNTQQYKPFKEGDNVLVYGVVESVGIGDVLISLTLANGEKTRVWVSMNHVGAAWALPSDSPSSPAPCASKYDPCRLFREGDIVAPCEHNGRPAWGSTPAFSRVQAIAEKYTVHRDEARGEVIVRDNSGFITFAHSHLKLITPVEETEPYSVETCQYGYTVNKGELILATYNDETHPNAKEAAEAECARLNARKESGK